jgi:acetoin utilization protein AcuC
LLSGDGRREVAPEPAERAVLEKFHSARYLDALQAAAAGGMTVESLYMGIGSPDCPVFAGMYEYSVLACGATLKGAEMILSGEATHAFNPSGGYHHAGPEKAAGFCYINDVALACGVLAEAGKRVLYLDVDVHHGDGVQDAFYDRKDVMTVSFHESGHTLFPGTGHEDEIGTGAGKGYCVNVPLPPGTYDQAYMWAFKAIALPLIKAYNPDVIVLEMGADTLAGDPLAHLQLTNNTCADIIQAVLGFERPVLMTGGGGYHVANTVRAWALAWSVLCGADAEHHDAHIGMGGVMLESTDWHGGLRDRQLPVDIEQSEGVIEALEATVARVKRDVFPLHGL